MDYSTGFGSYSPVRDGRDVPAFGSLIVPSLWVHAVEPPEVQVTPPGRYAVELQNIVMQPAEPSDPIGFVDVPSLAFPPIDTA